MRNMMGQAFPFRTPSCDQEALHSPFRLEYDSTTPVYNGNSVCFRLELNPCDEKHQCCTAQELFKVELNVGE